MDIYSPLPGTDSLLHPIDGLTGIQTLYAQLDFCCRVLVYITQLIRFTLVYYKFQLMRLHGLIILERELSMFRKGNT